MLLGPSVLLDSAYSAGLGPTPCVLSSGPEIISLFLNVALLVVYLDLGENRYTRRKVPN